MSEKEENNDIWELVLRKMGGNNNFLVPTVATNVTLRTHTIDGTQVQVSRHPNEDKRNLPSSQVRIHWRRILNMCLYQRFDA